MGVQQMSTGRLVFPIVDKAYDEVTGMAHKFRRHWRDIISLGIVLAGIMLTCKKHGYRIFVGKNGIPRKEIIIP